MLKNNSYNYDDCWTYFWFANVYSKDYNLFITNKNDLTIENTIGASTSFESAAFQDGNYYTGTKKTQKTFKRKCAAEGLTLSRYKEMMTWLEHGTRGMLFFEYDPWWGWLVVLDTVGDAKVNPVSDGTLIVEFDLTFKTVGTYLAKNRYDAYYDFKNDDRILDVASTNQYHIPTITIKEEGKEEGSTCYKLDIYIQGINNYKQEVAINQSLEQIKTTDIIVDCNDTEYLNVKIQVPTTETNLNASIGYDSKLNFLFWDNNLIESSGYYKQSNQEFGILDIKSVSPIKIIPLKVVGDSKNVTIYITPQQCNDIITRLGDKQLFVCNSQPIKLANKFSYGNEYYYGDINCKTQITHNVTFDAKNNQIIIPTTELVKEDDLWYNNWYIGVYNKVSLSYKQKPPTITTTTIEVKSYNNL
jgi:hypothetical protein